MERKAVRDDVNLSGHNILSTAINSKHNYLYQRMKTLVILTLTTLFVSFTMRSNAQNCTITCPENIVAKADSGKGGVYVQLPGATTSGACGQLSYAPTSGSFFKIGSTSVIVTSASGQ